MAETHVIGGGLAGLTAALALAERGRRVIVHEASRHLGGRCRSYHDPRLDRMIDNGTHALAGANPSALALLDRLGARAGWVAADTPCLRVADLAANTLRAVAPPSLASLWSGRSQDLARPGLSDLAGLARALLGPDRPVAALFAQTPFYREVVDPLTVAALNTQSDAASSKLLGTVLKAGLAPGRDVAPLMPLIARRGLGADLVDPLARGVERAGATIHLGSRIDAIETRDGRASALTRDGETIPLGEEDRVCLAAPAQIAARLLPGTLRDEALIPSPIVNAHFVLERPLAGPPRMVGVLGGRSQWLALRGDMVSTTVSAADALAAQPSEAVGEALWGEARAACRLLGHDLGERPAALRIVKERWATLRQSPGLQRPPARTRLANLVLAGDWTATGLPFTIEGAIRSGQGAAEVLETGAGR